MTHYLVDVEPFDTPIQQPTTSSNYLFVAGTQPFQRNDESTAWCLFFVSHYVWPLINDCSSAAVNADRLGSLLISRNLLFASGFWWFQPHKIVSGWLAESYHRSFGKVVAGRQNKKPMPRGNGLNVHPHQTFQRSVCASVHVFVKHTFS